MGKIACANVVSDLYAMGVVEIDNILMLLALSTKMTENEKFVISKLIIDGFKDAVREVGSKVTGGDTVVNPWCTLGGVATAICTAGEYIMPENAEPGDELVLTKPLGTQVAVHAYQWLNVPERWEKVKLVVTEDEVLRGYQSAINSMTKLNKTAAVLMHKYGAHAATDVTGFGILGHAQNLARFQKKEVSFVIHNLPVISKMQAIDGACNNRFKLNQGYSPETSGGLLICMPREKTASFCNDFSSYEGCQAWVVGVVEKGNKSARIIDKPRFIEVSVEN